MDHQQPAPAHYVNPWQPLKDTVKQQLTRPASLHRPIEGRPQRAGSRRLCSGHNR